MSALWLNAVAGRLTVLSTRAPSLFVLADDIENLQPRWSDTLREELLRKEESQLTPIEAVVLLDAFALKEVAQNYAQRCCTTAPPPLHHLV